MTFLMTCIVIYLYTVIAFNFFRKFYVHKVDDDFRIMKCQSMFQVSIQLSDISYFLKSTDRILWLLCKPLYLYVNITFVVFSVPHWSRIEVWWWNSWCTATSSWRRLWELAVVVWCYIFLCSYCHSIGHHSRWP